MVNEGAESVRLASGVPAVLILVAVLGFVGLDVDKARADAASAATVASVRFVTFLVCVLSLIFELILIFFN